MDKKEFDERLNALSERVLSKALTADEETNYTESLFESIRHVNEYGQEFWYARELQVALEYKQWRRFCSVIEKAKAACEGSNYKVSDHFADVGKMVTAGVASKEIDDMELSRYACYLIVQNGDPRKKVIALGQSYFAVKTRQQELIDNYDDLNEDQKRLAIRKENANQTHYAVDKEVRDTIKRLGGTMPEDLPTPDKSIKQLEREQKLLQNKK